MTIPTTTIERSATRQLKTLLALAQTRGGAQHDDVPTGLSDAAELARQLTSLCEGTPQSGEALLATVASPHSALQALRGIKTIAQSLAAKADTPGARAAATLLYQAAAAAALVRHGVHLSSRGARRELYEDLASLTAGSALAALFVEAAQKLSGEPPASDGPG